MSLHLVPLTLPQANAMVAKHHRHHAPLPGGFSWFCVPEIHVRDLTAQVPDGWTQLDMFGGAA